MRTIEELLMKYKQKRIITSINERWRFTLEKKEVKQLRADINAAIDELWNERDRYKEAWLNAMHNCLNQDCYNLNEGVYNHMNIETYKEFQRELVNHGRIKLEECKYE